MAFDAERFLAAVDDRLARFGQCAIAVAEGITDADGRFVAEAKKSEVYGHEQLGGAGHWIAQLLLRERGISAHVAQVDYLQRAGGHLGSSMDVRQAYIMGERAVEWLLAGKSGVMAGIKRIQDHPYCWDVVEVPLSEVGDQEKRLPPEFIGADGFSVTPAFLDYVRPLMEGERIPPFKDGRRIIGPSPGPRFEGGRLWMEEPGWRRVFIARCLVARHFQTRIERVCARSVCLVLRGVFILTVGGVGQRAAAASSSQEPVQSLASKSETRRKRARKRNVQAVHEHFELGFNAVSPKRSRL